MTNTAKRLLSDIRDLVPDISSRAAEIEAGRRIPLDLVAMLRSIGVFRNFVPQSLGGLELNLPAALEIFAALCRNIAAHKRSMAIRSMRSSIYVRWRVSIALFCDSGLGIGGGDRRALRMRNLASRWSWSPSEFFSKHISLLRDVGSWRWM
jgi:hypothetical protein